MDGLAGAAPMDKMKDRLKEWLTTDGFHGEPRLIDGSGIENEGENQMLLSITVLLFMHHLLKT